MFGENWGKNFTPQKNMKSGSIEQLNMSYAIFTKEDIILEQFE